MSIVSGWDSEWEGREGGMFYILSIYYGFSNVNSFRPFY